MVERILVTAAGGDVACSALRCIRNSRYVKAYIAGCDINPYNQGLDYLDEFFQVARFLNEEAYLRDVKKICREKGIQMILPMSERELPIFCRYKRYFQENGIMVLIHEPRILDIFLSKFHTVSYLQKIGLMVPKTCWLDEFHEQWPYPVLVKPDRGCGGHKNRKIDGKEELLCVRKAIEREEKQEPYVIQQYVGTEQEEYTSCIFSDGTQMKSITLKRRLSKSGFSDYVEIHKDIQIDYMLEQIAKAVHLKGSINVQFRKEGGRPLIFEINPRISSTVGFRAQFGFSDLAWWMELEDTGSCVMEYENPKGMIGIKTYNEKIFAIES